jgi:hypothetical protein
LFASISHGHDERFKYTNMNGVRPTREYLIALNMLYSTVKYDLEAIKGGVSQPDRNLIRELATNSINKFIEQNYQPVEMYLDIGERTDCTRLSDLKFGRRILYKIEKI